MTPGLGVPALPGVAGSFLLRMRSKDPKFSPLNLLGIFEMHPEGSCFFCLFNMPTFKCLCVCVCVCVCPPFPQPDLGSYFPWVSGGARSLMEVTGVAALIYLLAPGMENLFVMSGLSKI